MPFVHYNRIVKLNFGGLLKNPLKKFFFFYIVMKEQSWIASECSSFWSPISPLTNQTIAMCWEEKENEKSKFLCIHNLPQALKHHKKSIQQRRRQRQRRWNNDWVSVPRCVTYDKSTMCVGGYFVYLHDVSRAAQTLHKNIKLNRFRRAPNRPTANRDYMTCKYLLSLPYYYCDTSIVVIHRYPLKVFTR